MKGTGGRKADTVVVQPGARRLRSTSRGCEPAVAALAAPLVAARARLSPGPLHAITRCLPLPPGKTHTLKMEEGVTIGQMNERIQQWTYAFADGRAYTVKQETARPQADGK